MSEDMEEAKRQQAVAAYKQRNVELIHQHFVEAIEQHRIGSWPQPVAVAVDWARLGGDKTVAVRVRAGDGQFVVEDIHEIDPVRDTVPLSKMVELVDLLRKKEGLIAELEGLLAEERDMLARKDAHIAHVEGNHRWALDWQAETQSRCFVRHQAMTLMQPLVSLLKEETQSRSVHAACQAALEAYEKVFIYDPGPDGTDAGVVEQRAGHPADRPAAEPAGARDLQCAGKAPQGEMDPCAGTYGRQYMTIDMAIDPFSGISRNNVTEKPQSSK